jgi:hypothetical protein
VLTFASHAPGSWVRLIQLERHGGVLSDTAQTETVSGTPPNETTQDNSETISATVNGSTVELSGIDSSGPVFGQLSSSTLSITRPGPNGQVVTDQYAASTPGGYNALVSQLQQSVGRDNNAEQQQEAQAKAAQQAALAAQDGTMRASCSNHGGQYQGSGQCWNVPDGHGHTFYVPLNPDGSPQSGAWPADQATSAAGASGPASAASPPAAPPATVPPAAPPTTVPQISCTGSDGATYIFNSNDIPPGYTNCHPS